MIFRINWQHEVLWGGGILWGLEEAQFRLLGEKTNKIPKIVINRTHLSMCFSHLKVNFLVQKYKPIPDQMFQLLIYLF